MSKFSTKRFQFQMQVVKSFRRLQRFTSVASTEPKTYNTESDSLSVDFPHHAPGVARLNHGSFGAVPLPVLKAQEEFRLTWLAQPDELYFSGNLHETMRKAAAAGATTLVPPEKPNLPPHQACLLENATVATCAVAYHWSKMVQPGDVILYLDVAYRACVLILNEYCARNGARLIPLKIPFPAITTEHILSSVNDQLEQLAVQGLYPRFAFLDHVSSQPAILLPLQEMIRLVRQHGEAFQKERVQVCVDAAHAVGSVPNVDVTQYDCDYYYSNLHKWGFAPSTATIFWSPHCPEMRHPITSWAWGMGLCEDAVFSGTRDYSAMAAVPAAVEYLRSWRSPKDGQTSAKYCHHRVVEAANFLADIWETKDLDSPIDEELVATQAMIRLPTGIHVMDRPGQVSRGIRDRLRDEYQIEAAVGNFGDKGNYVRLSWAVYNNMQEIDRLANAVLELRN